MENKMRIATVLLIIYHLRFKTIKCTKSVNEDTVVPPGACPCEYKYNPVCGSDNITYINECILKCNNDINHDKGYGPISKVSLGECDSCICQNINLPVCTLDGEIYPNECALACENIRRIQNNVSILYLAYRSACLGPPCSCTNIAMPVCGDDDILYRNECVLDCASIDTQAYGLPEIGLKNYGACLDGCLCPLTKDPICGSDGKMYDNLCEMECQNKRQKCSKYSTITVADKSICLGCFCASWYDPVCGSDGRTYNNLCELNCERKRLNDLALHVVDNGTCPTSFCTDEIDPVCGTNYHTYDNECELRWSNRNSDSDISIGIIHHGICERDGCDCNHCSNEYKPVCCNGEQTFWNLCWLNCYEKCNTSNDPIYIIKEEACYV